MTEKDTRKELPGIQWFPKDMIDRVCFLIGHHHSYDSISSADYQILVEADFLVNIYEDGLSDKAARSAYERIFKTKTGKAMWKTMYTSR